MRVLAETNEQWQKLVGSGDAARGDISWSVITHIVTYASINSNKIAFNRPVIWLRSKQ